MMRQAGERMYQKEIIYMDLLHNDVKQSCAGYLKLDKRQERYRAELQVKNISNYADGSFPIRLQDESGWREEGMLILKDGSGRWTGSMEKQVMAAEILLRDSYRIKGQSKRTMKADEAKETSVDEVQRSQSISEAAEEPREQQIVAEREIVQPEQQPVQQTKVNLQKKPFRAESADMQKKQKNVPLYENKWEQLLTTYEQIHPYGDDRVYVKLEPKDFIVLRANYQHLVNNSFLLHGFYNYRYLILGKEKDYYLGVPGVFYEREKMVALMFGFEAFECEGGEAEEGKFGYYLRKVEL